MLAGYIRTVLNIEYDLKINICHKYTHSICIENEVIRELLKV